MVYPWAAPLLLLVLAIAVALPIYRGSFAQDRIARIAPDLAMRQAHWADALAMRDSGLLTELFGMGIGRFPDTHYWRSNEAKAGRYRLEAERGGVPDEGVGALEAGLHRLRRGQPLQGGGDPFQKCDVALVVAHARAALNSGRLFRILRG